MRNFWQRLSNFGITAEMPVTVSRKVILANQIAYISFGILFFMNTSFLFIESIEFDILPLLSTLIILTTPLLNKLGYYKISSFTIATLMPIAAMFFSSVSKTLMPPPIPLVVYIFPKLFLLSLLVLPLILIDSRNKLLISGALSINLACIFLVENVNEMMGVGLDFKQVSFDNFDRLDLLIVFPIAILLFGFLFLININNKYEDQIINQNQSLEKANNKIEKINYDLYESIRYAEYIQRAILPEKNKLNNFFADNFIYYKAKSIVSGDFYFFKESKIDGNKCIVITAADCTGHGVPGGFMSMLGMSFLNDIVREGNFTDAADILNQLRFNIKIALNQTGKEIEQTDGIEMALIIYYPDLNKLEFSGAKNPLYLISEKQEITIFKADRMPIGIHLKENPFTNTTIHLKGSEICYLFSDGVIDQMNEKGEKFTSKRLRTLLQNNSNFNFKKQEELLTGKMTQWMLKSNGELMEQIDDMLLVGLKIPKHKA